MAPQSSSLKGCYKERWDKGAITWMSVLHPLAHSQELRMYGRSKGEHQLTALHCQIYSKLMWSKIKSKHSFILFKWIPPTHSPPVSYNLRSLMWLLDFEREPNYCLCKQRTLWGWFAANGTPCRYQAGYMVSTGVCLYCHPWIQERDLESQIIHMPNEARGRCWRAQK
jgi:hypothetical protein